MALPTYVRNKLQDGQGERCGDAEEDDEKISQFKVEKREVMVQEYALRLRRAIKINI